MNSPTGNNSLTVLATDLDGTLIPLEDDAQNCSDLKLIRDQLERHAMQLVFVTGRHLASVEQAIVDHQLPKPEWIICDVGSSIYRSHADGSFHSDKCYQEHLAQMVEEFPIPKLKERLSNFAGLTLQEAHKQGTFKLSYYADADQLPTLVKQLDRELAGLNAPYSIIDSVDPFNGDGLIDLLPRGVSKAHALQWWVDRARLPHDAVAFAGDSGNDLAALLAGYRTIVVANAAESVARQVRETYHQQDWSDRLFIARQRATSGVLEGLRHFDC